MNKEQYNQLDRDLVCLLCTVRRHRNHAKAMNCGKATMACFAIHEEVVHRALGVVRHYKQRAQPARQKDKKHDTAS